MEVDVTRMVEAHIMVAGMLVSIAGEQGDLQAVDVIDRLRRQLLQERC